MALADRIPASCRPARCVEALRREAFPGFVLAAAGTIFDLTSTGSGSIPLNAFAHGCRSSGNFGGERNTPITKVISC
jgi:hypothetical protein